MRKVRKILKSGSTVLSVPFVAVLLVFGARLGVRAAHSAPIASRAAGSSETDVARLLLSMGTNGNGNVSKQEFMSEMEREFEKLDRNKAGVVNVEQLSRFRTVRRDR